MANVWRIHLKTAKDGSAKYCIDNNIAAMGWGFSDNEAAGKDIADDFEKYEAMAKEKYGKIPRCVRRLAFDVHEDDLIWTRYDGKYYIARVTDKSKWSFVSTPDAVKYDMENQLSDIEWKEAGERADEGSVPGIVATAFIKGATLQRINKPGIREYSMLLYNELYDKRGNVDYYKNIDLKLSISNFYSMLQPEDAEDLLCMWLYKKKGYICIPSTNKLSTPKYECILIDPAKDDHKHIYIQVKKGKIHLNAEDYKYLDGDVYLLTTEGTVENSENLDNVIPVNPNDLYDFALEYQEENIIPESIRTWVKFMTQNEKPTSAVKGIMFDTNKSYSDTAEYDMLEKRRICAYGNAEKYISSFCKNDYVLYYSKGKGIMAMGKILSDESMDLESGDGKYRDVEILVPSAEKIKNREYRYISPNSIKSELERGFYFASTIKTPFLDENQCEKILKKLKSIYE